MWPERSAAILAEILQKHQQIQNVHNAIPVDVTRGIRAFPDFQYGQQVIRIDDSIDVDIRVAFEWIDFSVREQPVDHAIGEEILRRTVAVPTESGDMFRTGHRPELDGGVVIAVGLVDRAGRLIAADIPIEVEGFADVLCHEIASVVVRPLESRFLGTGVAREQDAATVEIDGGVRRAMQVQDMDGFTG